MTYEEAKECVIYFKSNPETEDTETIVCANILFDKILEALEKQIRKKPNYYYNSFADGNPVWECSCPNCGTDLEESDHHCICGQLIDWSEEK